MAIETLMRYLEDGQKVINIKFEQGFIQKTIIKAHKIFDDKLLQIYTREGILVNIAIADFKRICFDSVVYDAMNAREMNLCLEYLRSFNCFKTYIQDKAGNYILSIDLIRDI